MTHKPIIEGRALGKRFGRLSALSDVSISIGAGEIRALCGENGAGKSTLVKLLTGVYQPDTGSVWVDGMERKFRSSRDSQASGVAFVSQELSIVSHLSVLDNIWLGHRDVPFFHRRASFRKKGIEALKLVGLEHISPTALAGKLSLGEKQLLEIARMLARDARILLLDEPTATLSDSEITHVFAAMRRVKASGRSVIFITHRLAEVFDICDTVTVLRNGAEVATLNASDTDRDMLIEMMLGRPLGQMYPVPGKPQASEGLAVRDLRVPNTLYGLNFSVKKGEILCIAGQIGSGAAEAVRTLAGLFYNASGSVKANGCEVRLGSVAQAMANNLRFISEDRAKEGIFLNLPIRINLVATQLARVSTAGVVSHRTIDRMASQSCARVGLDVDRIGLDAGDLSGGNQQKIAFVRCLTEEPFGILLMNEPTRGIDVGARAEIYALMRHVCAKGYCIVMMSTDIEEVVGMADSVLTMYRGQQVGHYTRAEVTRARILSDITHAADETKAAA